MQHLEEGTIHAWIDGQLSADEVRELEAHLASCEVCAQLAAEARGFVAASSRIMTALDNVPGDVIPIAPPAAIPAQAAGDVTPIGTRPVRRWRTPFWMRTAAAVVVIAGASALVMTGKLNNVRDESTTAALSMPMELPASAAEQADMAILDSAPVFERAPASGPVARAPSPPRADARSGLTRGAVRTSAGTGGIGGIIASAPQIPEDEQAKPGRPASRTQESRDAMAERHMADRAEARSEAVLLQKLELDSAVAADARAKSRREGIAAAAGNVLGRVAGFDTSGAAAPMAGSAQATAAAPPATARRIVERPAGAVKVQSGAVGDAFGTGAGSGSAAKAGARRPASYEQRLARGCYALTLSPWSGGTIPFGSPPPRIELDSLSSLQESIRGLNLVHPARGAASNGAPLAYWATMGDSIYVTWRDDQRGVMMKLPLYGDTLQGSARTLAMSPGGEPTQSSRVEARRISCRE